MEWYWIVLIVVGVVALLALVIWGASKDAAENQKLHAENTLESWSKEEFREIVAEKLGIKPSQIRFYAGEQGLYRVKVMKLGSPV